MPVTILVSSAGRRVGLIDCFRQSAAALGLDLTVLACDMEPELSSACRAADHAFKVPSCTSPDFPSRLLGIAREHGVALVVPTIDPELGPLAAHLGAFAANGIRVHVSPPSVIEVVRDKYMTAVVLTRAGVPVPETHELSGAKAAADQIRWPMFLKPSRGSASRGIRVVHTPADLPVSPAEPMILQQFLQGPEYTINMFISESGELRSAVAHRRLRVRAGEVEKGCTERNPLFRELAEGVLRALPDARGVLCFQAIIDRSAGPRVFEINARFGGGYPLAHYAGAEYTRWLLEEVTGLPSTANDAWRSGALMLRYDAAVFAG